MYIRKDDMKPFEKKIWLASPTMHGDELEYVTEAYETNWMSTVGANINEVERIAAESAEVKYAVALSSCTAALHLCVKLAGERLYGKPAIGHGALEGKKVFCSDVTFDATLNPVVYEGGIPVFIDTERDSWNMNPIALEKAFEIYPEVKLVVSAELYGFSGDIKKIKEICEVHGALLIEDAAEAMGASWDGKQCGSYGDYSAVSYNGNKIIRERMRLIILGMGGYGRTIADVAEQTGMYEEIIFLDDQADQAMDTCASYWKYADRDVQMYPAFGNNKLRTEWVEKLKKEGISVPMIVHPFAYVSPKAKLSEGCVVLPYAIINTECHIAEACIVNCGAIIDHGCILEKGVHVAPGGIVKAENRIPAYMKVDSGEVIQNRSYQP